MPCPAAVKRWTAGKSGFFGVLKVSGSGNRDLCSAGAVAQCPSCNATVLIPIPGIVPGMKIAGYETVRRLGAGGMGEVWLARQTAMDRKVALKILPPALTINKDFVDRFLREVKTAAKLEHQNIVTASDAGCDGSIYYLAMSFVDGALLEKIHKPAKTPQKAALAVKRQQPHPPPQPQAFQPEHEPEKNF